MAISILNHSNRIKNNIKPYIQYINTAFGFFMSLYELPIIIENKLYKKEQFYMFLLTSLVY